VFDVQRLHGSAVGEDRPIDVRLRALEAAVFVITDVE
jgi:hypothetical protein